ncbi:MAG: hypothetical protein JO329_20880 [Planctomycetaceae bacterium]|nr:hypothetical protein [Planctomycetaceae bacterium]
MVGRPPIPCANSSQTFLFKLGRESSNRTFLLSLKIGTLNLHHGIAPSIRGMNSIYWALWEGRPEWIGSTVHFIDKGIDTAGFPHISR